MRKRENQFKAANAILYVLSNEDADKLKATRVAAKLGNTFVSLSDKNAMAAEKYAGRSADGPWLNPATFVIGKDGKIVYADVGETVSMRAYAEAVLKAVQQANKENNR